jgi:hypothetical protein
MGSVTLVERQPVLRSVWALSVEVPRLRDFYEALLLKHAESQRSCVLRAANPRGSSAGGHCQEAVVAAVEQACQLHEYASSHGREREPGWTVQ